MWLLISFVTNVTTCFRLFRLLVVYVHQSRIFDHCAIGSLYFLTFYCMQMILILISAFKRRSTILEDFCDLSLSWGSLSSHSTKWWKITLSSQWLLWKCWVVVVRIRRFICWLFIAFFNWKLIGSSTFLIGFIGSILFELLEGWLEEW